MNASGWWWIKWNLAHNSYSYEIFIYILFFLKEERKQKYVVVISLSMFEDDDEEVEKKCVIPIWCSTLFRVTRWKRTYLLLLFVDRLAQFAITFRRVRDTQVEENCILRSFLHFLLLLRLCSRIHLSLALFCVHFW